MAVPLMNNSKELEFDIQTYGDPKDPCVVSIVGTGASMNAMNLVVGSLAEEGLFVINYNPRDVCGSKANKQCAALIPEGKSLMEEMGKVFKEDGTFDTEGDFYAPFNWYDMADDVAAILDKLDIEKASVLGFSTGATITQCVMCRIPDRLHAAVIISSSYDMIPMEKPAENKFLQERLAMQASVTAESSREERVEKILPSDLAMFEVPEGDPREKIFRKAIEADYDSGWINTFGPVNPYAVLSWASWAKSHEEHRAKLKANKVPCLIIAGRNDPVVPFAQSEKLAANCGNAYFEPHEHGHILGPQSSFASLMTTIGAFIKSRSMK